MAMRVFLSVLLAIAGSAAISSAADAALLVGVDGRGVYKPRSYCPANHMCFKRARWLVWGSTRAVARVDAKASYPGAARSLTGRIRVTFTRVRMVCGGKRYTRASWRLAGQTNQTSLNEIVCSWTGG
jgi:hypothetical protein